MAGDRASFYRRRAEEERAASETATTIEARRVHLDMANLYETKANVGDGPVVEEADMTPDGVSTPA